MKDVRYKTCKVLIEHKHIINFNEIFETVPKSVLAGDIGTNNYRISRLIEDPISCSMKDICAIAELLGVTPISITILILNQIDNKKGKK